MKLYRFLTRSYFNGMIVEPGEEVMAGDNVVPSAHMVDVAAESAALLVGLAYVPPDTGSQPVVPAPEVIVAPVEATPEPVPEPAAEPTVAGDEPAESPAPVEATPEAG